MDNLAAVESIFFAALEKNTPEERAAYLDEACGQDARLRASVERLLRAQPQVGGFLQTPAPGLPDTAVEQPRSEGPGTRIGPYKLLQKLGEGGMGAVWVAEQTQPVKRRVALKLIKAGMDSRQVIRRFEQERQALALMDHTNIAKVLDAGATAEGRPYFVMELVKGIPITRYCDELQLSLRERLGLFVPVCQAIQHAHQKGIIHRDIKPSNVLVAVQDGKPAARVIDFGVAKALHQHLTEQSLYTEIGQVVGTLEYMSPEQAELSALDIDTRADVYALGVLLYELLTGTTPLDRNRLREAGFVEVLRLIREQESPRPSTRLSESKERLAGVAAMRRTEPARLTREVRGELDWIVMKCLEKDRTRRYESASGLAKDIERYLHDEPVEACPPSAGYRLRKLARKYRRGLATAAALLLLLVTAAVVSIGLGVWALREERLANQRLDDATRQQQRAEKAEAQARGNEAKAREEAAKAKRSEEDARAVLRYFQDRVLSAGRPLGRPGGQGRGVTLRQAVDAAEPAIARAFADRPLVEASIRNTLGLTYWYLGEAALAIRQHERGLALRQAKLGADHLDTLRSRNDLALAYRAAGRSAEAIPLLEQNRKLQEAKLGADHPDTLNSCNNLASAYWGAGRTAEAIPLLEQTLKRQEARPGTDHPDTLSARNNLALAYQDAGRSAEAIRLLEQDLKRQEARLGADHLDTLTARNNLASAYWAAGRSAEAIRLHEQTLKQREAKLGADHPDTLNSCNNLASAYRAAGRTAEAIRLLEKTLKRQEAKLGADHPDTLNSCNNLASAYRAAGRTAEAIPLLEQTLKRQEARLGADHPDTLNSRHNLALAYEDAGRTAEAIRLLEKTLKQREAKLGADHPNTLRTRNSLASAYRAAGRTAEAIPLLEQNLKQREAKLGADHPRVLLSIAHLAVAYGDAGRPRDAIALLELALERGRKRPGGLPGSLGWVPGALAETYDGAGQLAKAEPLYRDSLKQARRQFGSDDPRTAGKMANLGLNLLRQHKYADAEPILRECLAIRAKKLPDDWATFNARSMLGGALLGQKKYADAEPLLVQGYEGMRQREARIPPAGKVRLTEALARLVRLYEATDKKDRADAWRKKLEAQTAVKKPTR